MNYIFKTRRGFSLLESVISLAIFLVLAIGVYGGVQFTFKILYQSRMRLVESGVLNEEVELLRNMPYEQVGIVNGSPVGVLARTVTSTKSGFNFTVTRVIRNVDDPFDGTIGGTPNDTVPADYKFADLEIVCSNCSQTVPLRLTTTIAPRYLEGDPTKGALFVRVFDANAEPVQGASVHVTSTGLTPSLDLTDTTNNQGMLQLLDLTQGVQAYNISVTKDGYTSEMTLRSSASIPNPIKPPASVIRQNVTSASFSIDRLAGINFSTVNSVCAPTGNATVNMLGTKLRGADPDTFLFNQNITTNAQGTYTLSNLVWDNYAYQSTAYDVIGSIPQMPISLLPGSTLPVTIILGANTLNSLLVNVKDSITGQPIANATVTVTTTGFTSTKLTGVGSIRQTDWSMGSGQAAVGTLDRYWTGTNVIVNNPVGDVKLRTSGANYVSPGWLESSTFDLGGQVNLANIIWEPQGQNAATGPDSLKLQIAVSNSSTPASWNYLGPDGTVGSYYTVNSSTIFSGASNNRYLRYKAFLSTTTVTSTPVLSDLSVTYTQSCTPPGQAYFGGLTEGQYSIQVTKTGFTPKTSSVYAVGNLIAGIDLEAN